MLLFLQVFMFIYFLMEHQSKYLQHVFTEPDNNTDYHVLHTNLEVVSGSVFLWFTESEKRGNAVRRYLFVIICVLY